MNTKIVSCVILIILMLNGLTHSQNDKKFYETLSINASFGSNMFYGDIRQFDWYPLTNGNITNWYNVSNSTANELNWGAAFSIKKSFNYVFGLRAQINTGKLGGVLINTKQPASNNNYIYFSGNVFETSLLATININNLVFPKKAKDRKLYSYAFLGVGLSNFRSTLRELPTDDFISAFGYEKDGTTKKDATTETVLPVGLGMKYKVSDLIDLYIEGSLHNINSDKLDAYVLNGSTNDRYAFLGFGVTVKLANDDNTDDWVSPYETVVKNNELIKQKIDMLSRDIDYDGVVDYFDKEPDTEEGALVDFNGRTLDSDNDGIPDHKDSEPYSNPEAEVDTTGIEADSDNDGVPDSKDIEPNTKAGAKVNFKGETVGGGTTTIAGNNGEKQGIYVFPSIYFDLGSSQIRLDRHIEKLATIAQVMRYYPDIKLQVIGYADSTGNKQVNLELSRKRAETVVKHLSDKYLIDKSRFSIDAVGSKEMLSTDNKMNRRVDFQIETE